MSSVPSLPIGNMGALNLFALLYPSGAKGFVETRCIDAGDGKCSSRFHQLPAGIDVYRQVSKLAEWCDVYVGVAPRCRERGTKTDIEAVHALWVDLDSSSAAVDLACFEAEPSAVVKTGSEGHHHAYWALADPIEPGVAERFNRALAERLGGDVAVADAGRVLRMPGTYNFKHDPPIKAALVACRGARYDLADLEGPLTKQLESKPKVVRKAATAQGPTRAEADPVQRVLDKLEGARKTGTGWQAQCPAHDDQRPSLSLTEGDDGRCLIHCFAGCTPEAIVAALDLTMTDLTTLESPAKRVAGRLIHVAEQQGLEVFQAKGVPYASITVDGRPQTWEVKSTKFELHLRGLYFREHGEGLRAEALREATETLAARAIFEGSEKPVFHRVAGLDDRVLIDIGDEGRRAIEVDAEGWRVIDDPEIHFVREPSDLPFPIPVQGGSIDELREFTNCADEASFRLLAGATIMCLHPSGPYPVIYITGEQGSAKSTHSRLVASLADPRQAPLSMGTPQTKDLAVIANGVRLVGFDNVSRVSGGFSDMLCQLVTGAGHRARELFTDTGQSIIEVKLPVQLNGIGNVIKRPDLQERVALIELRPIPPEDRRFEEEFYAAWKEARPRIFGAILDGVSAALAGYKSVALDGYPRMADFARWGEAAGAAYGWEPGSFVAALEGGQAELREGSMEGFPELEALLRLLDQEGSWEGRATDLLALLGKGVKDDAKGPDWPTKPDVLSKRLDEYAPFLRANGFEFERERRGGGSRTRVLRFTRTKVGDAGTQGDAE